MIPYLLAIKDRPGELEQAINQLLEGTHLIAEGRWRARVVGEPAPVGSGFVHVALQLEPLDETARLLEDRVHAAQAAAAQRAERARAWAKENAERGVWVGPKFDAEALSPGRPLTVGELRAWLAGIPDGFVTDVCEAEVWFVDNAHEVWLTPSGENED